MRRDNCDIGPDEKILQVIEEMRVEQGEHFSLEKLNLAELGRRTGISRERSSDDSKRMVLPVAHMRQRDSSLHKRF